LVGVDVIFLLKNSRTCSLLKKQLYVEKKTWLCRVVLA
jgi:hypothetical protein